MEDGTGMRTDWAVLVSWADFLFYVAALETSAVVRLRRCLRTATMRTDIIRDPLQTGPFVMVPLAKVFISLVKGARNGWQEKGHYRVGKIFIFLRFFDVDFEDMQGSAVNIGWNGVFASKNGFEKK